MKSIILLLVIIASFADVSMPPKTAHVTTKEITR